MDIGVERLSGSLKNSRGKEGKTGYSEQKERTTNWELIKREENHGHFN